MITQQLSFARAPQLVFAKIHLLLELQAEINAGGHDNSTFQSG